MDTQQRRTSATGSIGLWVAALAFIVSLAVAAWVTIGPVPFPRSAVPEPTPAPGTIADQQLLEPNLTLDAELEEARADLTDALYEPLRAYYATRAESLNAVTVSAGGEAHTTQVTIELRLADDTTAHHTFYFDRSGPDRDGPFPRWSLSMLDNTD